jgi:hypothetical protein
LPEQLRLIPDAARNALADAFSVYTSLDPIRAVALAVLAVVFVLQSEVWRVKTNEFTRQWGVPGRLKWGKIFGRLLVP